MGSTVVLITGGSGFLGQHLIRELQEKEETITEIRILDLVPYENKLGVRERIPIKTILGDITKENDKKCIAAFEGVESVLHCAAHVSYKFPSEEILHTVNIQGTNNVIKWCLEHSVKHLVYTSTAEVAVKPYFRNFIASIIVNATETKAQPPEDRTQFVFGDYAWSKLEGENLVLAANGIKHNDGQGWLKTVSLRPTTLYGECDQGYLPLIMDVGTQLSETFYRIGGLGGKHQFCYAGNAAWAHLCALKTLQDHPESVEGHPVFITDDTFIYDQFRFCEKFLSSSEYKPWIPPSCWYLPTFIFFILALVYEVTCKIVDRFYQLPRLPLSPKSMAVYSASVVFFSRLRATIHLNYRPIYPALKVFEGCRNYYINRLQSKTYKKYLDDPTTQLVPIKKKSVIHRDLKY